MSESAERRARIMGQEKEGIGFLLFCLGQRWDVVKKIVVYCVGIEVGEVPADLPSGMEVVEVPACPVYSL